MRPSQMIDRKDVPQELERCTVINYLLTKRVFSAIKLLSLGSRSSGQNFCMSRKRPQKSLIGRVHQSCVLSNLELRR